MGSVVMVKGNRRSAYDDKLRFGFMHTVLGVPMAVGSPVDVLTQATMKELYNVDITVLNHQGRPVIVDAV